MLTDYGVRCFTHVAKTNFPGCSNCSEDLHKTVTFPSGFNEFTGSFPVDDTAEAVVPVVTSIVTELSSIFSSRPVDKTREEGGTLMLRCEVTGTMITPDIPLSGSNDGSAVNLAACVGECDSDAQCAVGLKCFQRSTGEKIPGCR